MHELTQRLAKNPIVYITRDIERALGFPLDTPGYFIISNATPFAKSVAAGLKNITLIEADRLLDTWELMEHADVRLQIANWRLQIVPNIVVFKNTPKIEDICKKNDWHLLNPSAALANKIEEKISQVEWLDDLAKFLPPHRIDLCKNISWDGAPFILQFNRAHTGTGTMLIQNEKELRDVQKKFPDRPARMTAYIDGPVFTNNNIVGTDTILIGNISYQITGMAPFTDNPFATIGNDWKLPHALLSSEQKKQYGSIARAVGEKLRADGWRGLFGIDVIVEAKTRKLHLLEINARQPASAAYESKLQSDRQTVRPSDRQTVTTFEAHLLALLGYDLSEYELIEIEDGAQIIQRVTKTIQQYDNTTIQQLEQHNFTVIPYPNTTDGSELLRIQSERGIMETHGELNEDGLLIAKKLENF